MFLVEETALTNWRFDALNASGEVPEFPKIVKGRPVRKPYARRNASMSVTTVPSVTSVIRLLRMQRFDSGVD
ncbi:hypothetical protein MFFC18_43750 [Mariniblastus fucicola]|uniref:Uncharacterized protein n=1 Tax=Mariniblastus fucicola TaxID=980251 RepID=A0A5B9PGU3_9BACT|nr:hypothetical protein MFFC18_43750 [Mariniblastus fucicola]